MLYNGPTVAKVILFFLSTTILLFARNKLIIISMIGTFFDRKCHADGYQNAKSDSSCDSPHESCSLTFSLFFCLSFREQKRIEPNRTRTHILKHESNRTEPKLAF